MVGDDALKLYKVIAPKQKVILQPRASEIFYIDNQGVYDLILVYL